MIYIEVIISVSDTKLIQEIDFCNQNNEKMIYETNFGHILNFWLYFGQKFDTKWSISPKGLVAYFSNLHHLKEENLLYQKLLKPQIGVFVRLTYLLQKSWVRS